jgi:hypothetical protein
MVRETKELRVQVEHKISATMEQNFSLRGTNIGQKRTEYYQSRNELRVNAEHKI